MFSDSVAQQNLTVINTEPIRWQQSRTQANILTHRESATMFCMAWLELTVQVQIYLISSNQQVMWC